jgi:hypothetical protein
MARYTLHYNSHCVDCRRLAEWNRRLDWLACFDRTTNPSVLGIPEIGDIHVIDHQTQKVYSGAYATKVVCRNIPAYWCVALVLSLPFVFERVARRKPGCNGEHCTTK